ncbi:Helix-turn-helix domain-containing protein [Solimonas aquatica]|uniref:Helix-turn-helix domain-containing protein n=1 Tax=Solimonas aquatica TaxID=489703 RepID=A0A1H9EWT7_9GAMM|nr:AraC family transcriptional regulator [Solimonas aquatica]SEQ30111.1 Helix-turn-helix domain-containing protein [Solimonas aquatica]
MRISASTSSGQGRHVLAAAASGVRAFIRCEGGNDSTVLSRAGLDGASIDNPLLPLDLGAYCRMMELAAADTGDDNFGLRYGQQFQPEQLGLIGQIALAAPNLGSALEHLAGLFPFHQQVTETAFREQNGVLSLEYRILDGRILQRRQDAELTLGMFANVLRRCLGADWAPDEVWFEHPRPGQWREHREAFRAPVRYGQSRNALRFRLRDPLQAMPGRDLSTLVQLRQQLLQVAGDTGQLSFVDSLCGEIRSRLVSGYPHIEAVAAALGLARWTLQRRLAESGCSYAELVEDLRRRLATQYLGERHLPLSDIAALLGYSELSAFTRACVRWFGAAPTQLRRQRDGLL